jgi:Transposase DDE domain
MHNLRANFDKIFQICKTHLSDYIFDGDNFYKYPNRPKMSDLEIVTLSITAESLSIDSENLLFSKLKKEYSSDFPNLIDRCNFNRRRKRLNNYIAMVNQNIANFIEPNKDCYILDSMPIPICKNIRIRASKICKDNENVLPTTTYHASHKIYYHGFKLQLLITKRGIPHTAALTTASMHDSQYLSCFEDVQIAECELIADMGYLSEAHQLNLFDSYKIKIITPLRANMNQTLSEWNKKRRYQRKRIETLNSQLDDQMMIHRNYAKTLTGLLTRITTKVAAVAVLQLINHQNKKPLNHIKHALAA